MRTSLAMQGIAAHGHWPRELMQRLKSEPMAASECDLIASLSRQLHSDERIAVENATKTQFRPNPDIEITDAMRN